MLRRNFLWSIDKENLFKNVCVMMNGLGQYRCPRLSDRAAFPTCCTSNIKFGECQTFIVIAQYLNSMNQNEYTQMCEQSNVFHGACDGATSIWIHTRMSKVQEETEQCLPWRMRRRHLNIWFLSLKVQMTSNYGPCLCWNEPTTLASQPCMKVAGHEVPVWWYAPAQQHSYKTRYYQALVQFRK